MPHHNQRQPKSGVCSSGNRTTHENEVWVKVLFMMVTFTCLLRAATAAVESSPKRKRKAVFIRRRTNWSEHATLSVDAGVFRRKYRMTLPTFRKLVRLLGPSLERNESFARLRTASGVIPVENCVAIAIRMLAGASYLDLTDTFGVSTTSVYDCLWSTVDAINNTRGVGDIVFPQGTEACRRLATAFEGRSTARGCMSGVVGAVDGLFVETEAPAATESLNTTEYYADQKKAYGLNVQAIASADYRFIAVSIKCPGAVNDFSAFTRSRAWELTRRLPAGFFILGDAAYPLDERLLTPYPGKNLSEEYDVFNFYHSQQRMVVEQSFDILVQTWGILWKPLRLGFHGRADVINAIFRLHNFLRDEGVDDVTPRDDRGSRDDDSPELDSDGVLPEEYRTQNEGTPKRSGEVQRRADIREALKDLGLQRPEHNVSRNADLG